MKRQQPKTPATVAKAELDLPGWPAVGERDRRGRSRRRLADGLARTQARLNRVARTEPSPFGQRPKLAGATPALPRPIESRVYRLASLALALLAIAAASAADFRGCQFLGCDRFDDWEKTPGPATNQWCLTSPPFEAGLEWDELVLSWNADTPPSTGLKFEVRVTEPPPATRFYTLGLWATDAAQQPRESVRNQKDERGEVQTDTLVLTQPARAAQVRVTFTGSDATARPALRFIGLSVCDRHAQLEPLAPNRAAWGRDLPVPERTQVIYPEGVSAWCSPTSLSMLLAFWAEKLDRRDLDLEVPAVAAAVNDPQWPGTGNWAFNVAFAGSLPGVRAFVARLSDISELEDWIAAGVPVAASVSYSLLRGQPREPADGHLVVVRGFTATGDPIVNDPGTGHEIRRVFPRANLARAWAVSHNTVYVVRPLNVPSPAARFGHW